MEKIKIPSFIDYTYATWHFWTITILWTLWVGNLFSVGEFVFSIVGTAIALTILYFFSYLLTRSAFKKINKI